MDQSFGDIRWKQRFQNFGNALSLLNEAVGLNFDSLSYLEKEGIIQRFEMTFELAWKCLKDKMQNDGLVLERISPKTVIRQAFEAKYITEIDTWFKMIASRNSMSHIYDQEIFLQVLDDVKLEFAPVLNNLHESFLKDV